MTPNSNVVSSAAFIPLNEWSEKTFTTALFALREYNKEQCLMSDGHMAAEAIDFEWEMPRFDQSRGTWINVEKENRGVTVLLSWVLN